MARFSGNLEVVDDLLELLDGFDEVQVLQVAEGRFDILNEWLGAGVALFDLSEVIISNHTVKESSNKFGISFEIQA